MTSANGRWYVAFLFAPFAAIPSQLFAGAKPSEQAAKMFEARLAELKGSERGEKSRLKAECLEKSIPSWHFFLVRHRVYPVQVVPEPPLNSNNVFAVSGNKVIMITDEKKLEQFFKDNLDAIKGETAVTAATTSWLRIAQELHHDGFFKFKDPSVERSGSSGTGVVHVVEQKGDKGKLTVILDFVDGKLHRATPGGKLFPGIRPRCQATRLLHKDPLVREIMRRDILVMGSDCKWYLDEVRASASAQLQKAIDDVWQQILDEGR